MVARRQRRGEESNSPFLGGTPRSSRFLGHSHWLNETIAIAAVPLIQEAFRCWAHTSNRSSLDQFPARFCTFLAELARVFSRLTVVTDFRHYHTIRSAWRHSQQLSAGPDLFHSRKSQNRRIGIGNERQIYLISRETKLTSKN